MFKTLQNALKNDRIAQAYIFSGTRGVGKTSAARILAKSLNCLAHEKPSPVPCNKCVSCTQINEDHAIDVLEIDGASNRGIEDIRSLRETVKYNPLHCRYKVIIIDEVHQVTKDGFNALLKTLEEPPPYTVFIFATTEFRKLPPTIVSRCQHFEFKKITQKDLINHLLSVAKKENITITDKGLALIAEAAEGSVRDAQSLLDQMVAFSGESVNESDIKEILGTIGRDIFFQCTQAILEERPEDIFKLVEVVMDKGHELRFFFSELIQHLRKLLIIKSSQSPGDILTMSQEDLKIYKESIKDSSAEDILRYLVSLQQAEPGMRYSSHPRIYLETTLVKLCHYKKLLPLKEILEKIGDWPEDAEKNQVTASIPEEKRFIKPLNREFSQFNKKEKKQVPDTPPIEKKSLEKTGEVKEPIKNETLEDPGIQAFMDTFKAKVISIEHKKKK